MGNKSKKGHKLYALTVIVLGIAIFALAIFVFFYVQKIDVVGNEYIEDKEIIEMLQEDVASVNSLYILGKYYLKKYEVPASLESMEISMVAPWELKVQVKEKPIVGYIYDDEGYVYVEKNGIVVCKGRNVIDGVPYIEGIQVDKAVLYEMVECKNKKLFKEALELTEQLKVYELVPDRILCANRQLYVYFGEICIALGTSVSQEKIAQITPILAELEGKSGTLHLEFYKSESSTITFNKGEFPEVSENEKNKE